MPFPKIKIAMYVLLNLLLLVGCNNPSEDYTINSIFSDKTLKVIIDAKKLIYNPTNEVIFCSILNAEQYINKPLAKYYMYYSPHNNPGGICLAYADKLDGPWFEYYANPIISNNSLNYRVSHVSSPHAIWNENSNKVYLYFHGENDTTRFSTSSDGIHFQYVGVALQSGIDGTWSSSKSTPGYYGDNYLHDQNAGQGEKFIKYNFPQITGDYNLSLIWVSGQNRSSKVKVIINNGSEDSIVYVDMRNGGSQFNSIGTYSFDATKAGYLKITNEGSDGYVVADAVKLTPVNDISKSIIIDNSNVDLVEFKNSIEGPSGVSYARVFNFSSGYVMLFMGENNGQLKIYKATSGDGDNWVLNNKPFITPTKEEGENISGPFLYEENNTYYVLYHSSNGKIHRVQSDADLYNVIHLGPYFEIEGSRVAAPFLCPTTERKYLFFDHGFAGDTNISCVFKEIIY